MFNRILSAIGVGRSAATDLATPPPPKVKNKPSALPSYATSAKMPQTALPQTDRRLASTDTNVTYRNASSTSKLLREMVASNPEFGVAIFSYLRVALTDGYSAVAYNPDKTPNPEATAMLQQIIARFDVLPDYSLGFNSVQSLLSVSECLAKEILLEGAMMGELVLDQTLLPTRIQPLSVSGTKRIPNKTGYLVPVQSIGGVDNVLDYPTIFYVALDQDLLQAYPQSPMESGIKATMFAERFIADLTRVVRRAVHPRISISIDYEKFIKSVPDSVRDDEEALAKHQNDTIAQVQGMINDLNPEDALVTFDFITIDYLNNGNASLSAEYKEVKDIANAKLASGTKTMPAVLGMDSTSNVASTQSMLFIKAAAGAVQFKLNEFYSRLLTLAVRLMGQDVYVKFKYNEIDLRPANELEAFKSAKQSRYLELLSLGFVSDEEAAIELTGHLPPATFKPLSGTLFKSAPASTNPGNDGSSNGGSALNKTQDPGSAGVKGQNKKADPQKTSTPNTKAPA